MKRILFVDDERRVLDGLKRMLRGLRKEWDMHFVESGAEALKILEQRSPFDVVVSDMRMPGMDGAELLNTVQERHPGAVRMILSGHAELELAMRSATCAHQFLTKPCDSEHIKAVVTRSFALHENLQDPRLKDVVGQLHSLPALPRAYAALNAAMADEEVTIESVADIISEDPGIAAKVLQLVNSSFFGVVRRIDSLRHAISYLGLANLKSLVLNYGILEEFDSASAAPSFDIEKAQQHTLDVANLARRMHEGNKKLSEQAFLGGMLHDIGKLVIATNLPDLFERVSRLGRMSGIPTQELERRALGFNHGDVGAYLLGIWGMPDPIVETAQLHHRPSSVATGALDVLGSVHVADALVHEVEEPEAASRLDAELVGRLGLEEHLAEWRGFAATVRVGEEAA